MTQDTTSGPLQHAGPWLGARGLACLSAVIAAGAAIWVALAGAGCAACHQAGALLPGVPLVWVGAGYYAVLAGATGYAGLTRWTRGGFFAAAGVHAALVWLLAQEHLFCGPCLTAAAAAWTGTLASLAAHPRALRWAGVPMVLAGGITLAATFMMREPDRPPVVHATWELPDGSTTTAVPAGHVRLVLYERDGCRHCLEFEELILPRIQQALGPALEIERREPTVDMETPTVVVVGKGSRVFSGVPDYKELEEAALRLR